MKLASALVAAVFCAGCASTTVIRSDPEGADVYVDGMNIGKTPTTYTDASTWDWSNHELKVEKEDYEPSLMRMSANQINAPRLIIGALLFWPILLATTDYPPDYTLRLEPKASRTLPPAAPASVSPTPPAGPAAPPPPPSS